MKKIGLQLYSVRNDAQMDFHDTLRRVADCGYEYIEPCAYYGQDPETLLRWFQEFHLKVSSIHGNINDLDNEISRLKQWGAQHFVCPSLPMDSKEQALKCAELANRAGKVCFEEGITFSYHNHAYEFAKADGQYLLDIFYDNTDPQYVKVQPDVFWISRGGVDPVSYVKQYADRCALIHCKDRRGADSQDDTAVGDGVIDFPGLLKLLPADTFFIVELEDIVHEPWTALEKSCSYLRSL